MSSQPLKNVLQDGIYENVVDNSDETELNYENNDCAQEVKIINEEFKLNNNGNAKGDMNNLMNSKDAVYAAPLRKSDRNKSRKSPDNYKINNDDADFQNLMDRTYLNSELGENRIKDFLKDTSYMHKKVEPPGKDHIGSSFSYLARKEHFVTLVHQNIIKDQPAEDQKDKNDDQEYEIDLSTLNKSLESSGGLGGTEKLLNKLVDFKNRVDQQSQLAQSSPSFSSRLISTDVNLNLNREWVLKKIAMCLEQKAYKKLPPTLPELASVTQQQLIQNSNLPIIGYLVLGSNGSGKTTICNDIIDGGNGTKGILNRRLLSFYLVNSQNPNCQSMSVFIRNMALQILSFSSFWTINENEETCKNVVDQELEEMIKNEQIEIKKVQRQQSAPDSETQKSEEDAIRFTTHPPLKSQTKDDKCNETKSEKNSPKKVSKIPVKIGQKSPLKKSTPPNTPNNSDDSIQDGGGEAIADINDQKLEEDIANELREAIEDDESHPKESDVCKKNHHNEKIEESHSERPLPLPREKDCRTILANAYFNMILQNSEIFDSLIVDNIEKNPDDCFKKAILFPLLELAAPKSVLLMLIDSIDENFLNDGTLITTLKGKNNSKSRNIAELLSNHIHLLPKWLFLVCTAKKQNKHIVKLFSGFKKLTLDDLRKSHVVKDVQQYIINRLNIDFRGINLNKEIIDSLNQLYIKSNGCLLYLRKVLNGIKENFFTFREIKLIPCTLYGLFLYLCQKSFNKKQYMKIRPILNILLASSDAVEKEFVFNCLKTHNYTIDVEEFERRLTLMKNILEIDKDRGTIKIFHNSFCEWLIDVKFSTKKFLCDINEGHLMIAMHYTLTSNQLCPNKVRDYIYHLTKTAEFVASKNSQIDVLMILLESKANLNESFNTNFLNCCKNCELYFEFDRNQSKMTRKMIQMHLNGQLSGDFSSFIGDFFKPSLPTDPRILKILMEIGINNLDSQISYVSSNANSPLFSDKSQTIDSEVADLLISSEKSCNTEHKVTNVDTSIPSLAIMNDTLETYEQLDTEMHKGKALIHILANDGNITLLEKTLHASKNPVDLEIEDYNGQTALNIAARNGHLVVVKFLLTCEWTEPSTNRRKLGVDVNHVDRDGWSPLRSAAWGGHTDVVMTLITHPNCDIDKADKEGRTALRAASWSGNEDIVNKLIAAKANVNSIDRQGRTSLIAASYMGHFDIVELLLQNDADVNHTDLDGRNALCVAALCGSSGYSRVISTLLEYGANPNQTDNEGMSPLLVSSFEGNAEICELLLENNADPDLADHMGRTPLWAACTSGHPQVVKLLLFWGCGIDCMDSEGRTCLSVSAAQGNLETVRQLLDRGLDETHRDNAGWTPLHYAAFEGYADICIQLLESGAKIDECDNEGKTALHLAAQEGHNAVIQALLQIHCACIDQRAHDGKTAFRLACLESHFECIQTLLKFGCDVNLKDADSRTTLYILALENKLKVVKFLLDYSNVNVNIPDSEGRTALHVAAWQGHTELVKMLITIGNADVNALDLEDRSPLHSCAWQGNHDVMQILLYYGAIPDHACKQGATALGISSQEGHEECVSVLLQYGANPMKSDHCGRTPFKLAAKSNRTGVLKLLENFVKSIPQIHSYISQATHKISIPDEHHQNLQIKSPDKPHEKSILQSSPNTPQNPNLLMVNNVSGHSVGHHHATTSSQSSNFYENTMHSDTSSAKKRKSVISSQSTGSSNEAPISFTQQLQKHSRHHNSKNTNIIQQTSATGTTPVLRNGNKVSHILSNVDDFQQMRANEADLFECMSPLYASPPHSPSSDLSSPQDDNAMASFNNLKSVNSDHFARDTHMRIILGNNIKEQKEKEAKSNKRSGIATNPAMRLIRNRIDSAANLLRRTNNYITSGNQGSSSIGVKSSTFQWRKESQM